MAYIDDELILEIKNALTVINLQADILYQKLKYVKDENGPKEISKQVKRIGGLLPVVKYEPGKKEQER